MIRPVTWRRSTLAAIALCATLLAGCSTDQPYEPPTGPTTSELPSDSGPSESPSPTPDGPQPAEHSQYWTDSQLAAVEVVERHKAAYASISRGETLHGDQLDLDPLWQVATDPEWEETSLYLRNWLASGERLVGEGIFTALNPGTETVTTDGRPQVIVRACLDPSPTQVLGATGQNITPSDRPSVLEDYTVQYVEERQAWLVALIRSEAGTC